MKIESNLVACSTISIGSRYDLHPSKPTDDLYYMNWYSKTFHARSFDANRHCDEEDSPCRRPQDQRYSCLPEENEADRRMNRSFIEHKRAGRNKDFSADSCSSVPGLP